MKSANAILFSLIMIASSSLDAQEMTAETDLLDLRGHRVYSG